MMNMKTILSFFLGVILLPALALAYQPVVTDSRIKTFVYNEYDVYNIYTQYGYQTNIEFAYDEEIVTVSVGDRIGWQIVPVGQRLFIRPMEEDSHTNMTVITSERAYQFDLSSSKDKALRPNEELSYVVRFYYPEEDDRLRFAPPVQPQQMVEAVQPPELSYNYAYTYTGQDTLAPLKIYDNGQQTFLEMPAGLEPSVFAVGQDGKEYPARATRGQNNQLVVDAVSSKIILRYSESDFVSIYNEGI